MLRIVMLSIVTLTALACGPEQSSLDRTADELKDRNDKATAIQRRAEGTYQGNLSGGKYLLIVRVMPTYVASGSRMELLEVPGLNAFLTPQNSENLSSFMLDVGFYDEDTNTLSLRGYAPGNRYVFNFISAKIVGDKLIGQYLNGVNKGEDFEFTRIGD